jgi:hypothetical protein
MFPATVVGVDFGGPRRTRDQRRRKIIAIAADAIADRRYRVAAIGMNARLLANDPPGWSAKELLDELLTRTVRIVAYDFPFSIPTRSSATRSSRRTPDTRAARSSAGGRSTRSSPSVCRLAIRSTSAHSTPGARAPTARACGLGAPQTSWLAVSHRSRTSSRRRSR